jgi:putative ABC transport system ATP-binding protein
MTNTTAKKPIIELKNVWKIYQVGDVKVEALRGMNWKVYPGEFVAIQGPSGSGKSTAMNMVGCLDIPSKGHIFLDGQDISQLSESELAQVRGKKIGFIFQKFNLINTLSAQENVMLPLMFLNVPEDERKEISSKVLSMVELTNRMEHKPNQLSGGQQQRVAIARALAVNPDIILADEPTGNLDSKSGAMVMSFLEKLHAQGKTIVMVTHDDKLAQYAERIAVLKDGEIIENINHTRFHGKEFKEDKKTN